MYLNRPPGFLELKLKGDWKWSLYNNKWVAGLRIPICLPPPLKSLIVTPPNENFQVVYSLWVGRFETARPTFFFLISAWCDYIILFRQPFLNTRRSQHLSTLPPNHLWRPNSPWCLPHDCFILSAAFPGGPTCVCVYRSSVTAYVLSAGFFGFSIHVHIPHNNNYNNNTTVIFTFRRGEVCILHRLVVSGTACVAMGLASLRGQTQARFLYVATTWRTAVAGQRIFPTVRKRSDTRVPPPPATVCVTVFVSYARLVYTGT